MINRRSLTLKRHAVFFIKKIVNLKQSSNFTICRNQNFFVSFSLINSFSCKSLNHSKLWRNKSKLFIKILNRYRNVILHLIFYSPIKNHILSKSERWIIIYFRMAYYIIYWFLALKPFFPNFLQLKNNKKTKWTSYRNLSNQR